MKFLREDVAEEEEEEFLPWLPPIPIAGADQDGKSVIRNRVWRLAAPAIGISGSEALAQVIDAAMVARLGTSALAALAPSGLVLLIPITVGIGALVAVTSLVAKCLGARNPMRAGPFAWGGVVFALAFGLLCLGLFPLAPGIFNLFGNPAHIIDLEIDYFRVGLFGIGPFLVGAAISNFFVGISRPFQGFTGSLVFLLANVFFNYLLIFGKLGCPELGFAGAAWGGVAASWAYCVFMLAKLLFPRWRRLGTTEFAAIPLAFRQILPLGIPMGLAAASEIIAWNVTVTWLVGLYGEKDLAAASILLRFLHLSYLPGIGVGVAVTALVAEASGAGRPGRARLIAAISARSLSAAMIGYGLIVILSHRWLLPRLSDDPQVIHLITASLGAFMVIQLFDGLGIVYGDALRGVGDSTWASWAGFLLCSIVLIGGGITVAFRFPELGSPAIWMVDAFHVALASLIFWARWRSGKWVGESPME